MEIDQALDVHINEIVSNNEIREQKNLQSMLKKRGYDIPQATLSRRLKRLKITKIDGAYKIVDIARHTLPIVLDLKISDFGMIVMHTSPGQAGSLGYYIDTKYVRKSKEEPYSSVLGCIAGDDTLILIVKNQGSVADVIKSIYKDFPYLEKLSNI